MYWRVSIRIDKNNRVINGRILSTPIKVNKAVMIQKMIIKYMCAEKKGNKHNSIKRKIYNSIINIPQLGTIKL